VKTTLGRKIVHCNGPITDLISYKDFLKLDYTSLNKKIEEIQKEPEWGDDLSIFKEMISETMAWIKSNCNSESNLYFINSEKLEKEKLVEYNYFTYYLSIIYISQEKSELFIWNHGGD
jgi:hypothetical protein